MFKSILSSRNVSVLIVLILIYFIFLNGVPTLYSWDLFGHYIYLPMMFDQHQVLYQDLSYFEHLQTTYDTSPTLYQFVLLDNGNFMTKYTIGWAILFAPFYGIAECWASLGSYPTDGFSFPYKFMLVVGAIFYFSLSMVILRKVLKLFFSDWHTSLILLAGVFGTNFFFMQYAALGISHNLEFFLIVSMLLLTHQFHEKVSLKKGILLGIVMGMIALVRPPDLVFLIVPFAWNYKSYGGILAKIRFFWSGHRKELVSVLFFFLATASIQLFWWKYVSGVWVMNSYANNPGEGFDWFTPYISELLFSYRKGWFVYTPLMLLACFGFYFWIRKKRDLGLVSLAAFLIFLYVISCWTTWWYAESFSQRAVVDAYPLLFISLGFLFVSVRKKIWQAVLGIVVSLLVLFNLLQTYQVHHGIIHLSRMSKDYYWSVFAQLSEVKPEQAELLFVNREEMYTSGKIDTSLFVPCFTKKVDFEPGFLLNKTDIYIPAQDFMPKEISKKEYFWLSVLCNYEGTASQLKGKIFNANMFYKEESYAWTGQEIGDPRLLVDTLAKTVEFHYFTPHFRTDKDKLRIGIWNQSGDSILIKSLLIQAFEPKIIHR